MHRRSSTVTKSRSATCNSWEVGAESMSRTACGCRERAMLMRTDSERLYTRRGREEEEEEERAGAAAVAAAAAEMAVGADAWDLAACTSAVGGGNGAGEVDGPACPGRSAAAAAAAATVAVAAAAAASIAGVTEGDGVNALAAGCSWRLRALTWGVSARDTAREGGSWSRESSSLPRMRRMSAGLRARSCMARRYSTSSRGRSGVSPSASASAPSPELWLGAGLGAGLGVGLGSAAPSTAAGQLDTGAGCAPPERRRRFGGAPALAVSVVARDSCDP
mmetsp:Transcript_26640/g.85759  ORF Transcript_26640/g.85759 Transcript_26640/m.85759 type:complete len:277 (-) Transcript_26640:1250-2080(-)